MPTGAADSRTRRDTLVAVGILALGLAHVAWLRFLYDDAYISFRYAANLAHGHGLVYNVGERVEGYSNFLWTLALAVVSALNGRLDVWSQVLSAACALAALAVVLRAARRRGIPMVLAGVLVAASTSWAAWGTGGLETAAYTLCLTTGTLALATASVGVSATAFGLACLVRLDGVVAAVAAAAFLAALVLLGRLSWRRFAVWLGLVAVFVVPHAAWRASYYGGLLPHTAIVKMPGLERFADGARYGLQAAIDLALWVPFGAIVIALALRRRTALPAVEAVAIASVVIPLAIYVASTGGDFMPAYRFVAPLVPLVGYAGAAALGALGTRAPARAAVAGAVLAYVAVNGVGSWRQQAVWTRGELVSVGWARHETDDWVRIGDLLHSIAAPSDTLATSAGGAVPYRSGLYTIEMNGLTTPDLSRFRRRLSRRPGHLITLDERAMVERPPQILLGHPLVHPTPATLALGLELRPEWNDRVLAHYQAVGLTLPGEPPRFVGCALRHDVADRIIAAGRRAAP